MNTIFDEMKLFVDDREKFPSKLISKCPAVMLADRRIDNVNGRIRFLVISIITMKFIRGYGVPVGTRCVIIFFVFFIQPYVIIESQYVDAIGNEIIIWAVGVGVKGVIAIKFMIININNTHVIII